MLNVVMGDGEAFSKSLSETMPTNLLFFITGARRICSFRNIARTSLIAASGDTEITGRDILSPTNILTSMVQATDVAICENSYKRIICGFTQPAVMEFECIR